MNIRPNLQLLSVRPSSPLQGWLGTDSGEEIDSAWDTLNNDRDLKQPGNSQTNSRWWTHRNIWSENNDIEAYDIRNNYNYITLTTQKAKRNKMHKFKKLLRRAKRRFRKEQRRHFNSYKKRTSYKRVSLDSKFYMRSKHQDGTQANVDPKSTAGNKGKEFQEGSGVRRLHIEKKRKEKTNGGR